MTLESRKAQEWNHSIKISYEEIMRKFLLNTIYPKNPIIYHIIKNDPSSAILLPIEKILDPTSHRSLYDIIILKPSRTYIDP